MADTKISALTAASALDGTETFPLVQSSTTKKGLISDIVTYLRTLANTWAGIQTFSVAPVFTQKRQSAAALGSWHVIAASGVQLTRASVNGAGDATETAFVTVTIPANSMGPNGAVRVTAQFDSTDSANSKTHRIRWGWVSAGAPGVTAYGLAVTTSAASRAFTIIHNRNSASSQTVGGSGVNNSGWGAGTAVGTASSDTTGDVVIAFTSAWAGATSAETNTLESYLVEVFYQA